MKFERKCPCCHRRATKRIGKLSFCENCAKDVRRYKGKAVWAYRLVFNLGGNCPVYHDYTIPVY